MSELVRSSALAHIDHKISLNATIRHRTKITSRKGALDRRGFVVLRGRDVLLEVDAELQRDAPTQGFGHFNRRKRRVPWNLLQIV
jgi:hypothetical protein